MCKLDLRLNTLNGFSLERDNRSIFIYNEFKIVYKVYHYSFETIIHKGNNICYRMILKQQYSVKII